MRKLTIAKSKEILNSKPVFIDTETTGLDSNAEICEITILDYDGKVLFDSLIKPVNPIPEKLVEIHGITNEMVKDAPTFAEAKEQIESALKDRVVAIYNQSFDIRLLEQSAKACGVEWESPKETVCIMALYSEYYGEKSSRGAYKWHKLTSAAEEFGIITNGAHRAKADCVMTLGVLEGIANAN